MAGISRKTIPCGFGICTRSTISILIELGVSCVLQVLPSHRELRLHPPSAPHVVDFMESSTVTNGPAFGQLSQLITAKTSCHC